MVNKIKTRGVKQTKYSKRKKFSKYRKQYTRKFVKRFQRRIKRRRQTRNKRGGVFNIPTPNEVKSILYRGYALVTKMGIFGPAILSGKDRREQILIFISKNNNNIFILRCVDDDRDSDRCKKSENVQIMEISLGSFRLDREDQNEFFFKSSYNKEEYRIKLTRKEQETEEDFKQSVQNFISKVQAEKERVEKLLSPGGSSKQAQGSSDEKVKIKSSFLGKETLKDANASIAITGETLDPEYPENIYTLFIDGEGKIKFLLIRNIGFSYDDINDKTIDGMCYRLYKFTDMDNESKSIEIYVPVSRDEGSIFYTLQPQLAANEDVDIFGLCSPE